MKWFSIKDYVPPTGNDLLLRILKRPNDPNIYERYIIASIECLYEDIESLSDWELANGAYVDITMENYVITHFAVIDPVEK